MDTYTKMASTLAAAGHFRSLLLSLNHDLELRLELVHARKK